MANDRSEEFIAAFRLAMGEAGVPYSGDIDPDGELHRVYVDGDRRGSTNGWYVLHMDERPAGKFGTWKGATHTWTAEGLKPLTREEREEMARKTAERKARAATAEAEKNARAAEQANAMWNDAAPAESHPYLSKKRVSGFGLRVGTWVKELRPGADGNSRVRRTPNALLVPLRDAKRNIVSLQAIFAEPLKVGDDVRTKDFVYGGRKAGCWFTIGKPVELDGLTTIVICEGYATGASVHMATGLGVVVAFDGGNLEPVAKEVRRLMPDARLVFAADNDLWTKIGDNLVNVGLTKAHAAAEAVGGIVVAPRFVDLTDEPTDFNDLHVAEGLDVVKAQVLEGIAAPSGGEEPPAPDGAPDGPDGSEAYEAVDPEDNGLAGPEPTEPEDPDGIETDGYFKVLGHDQDSIYVYVYEKKMITRRGEADWSEAAMVTLAPLQWWEREFPGEKGFNKKMAHNWLVRTAYRRGYFDPSSRRGRGAWRDDGRVVYHFGDRLMIDGKLQDGLKINSTYVYEQGRRLRLPAETPLTAEDAKIILEVAQSFHWTRPASAILLAGWCVLAPLCGALRWRPHVWITGGAGSGKTTVLNDFVLYLMNSSAIYAQGNSTEAGIRQTLRMDALAVLFDETEQNTDREQMRVQAVIAMIRQSSTESEARTFKGTQGGDAMDFMIRSMFCLSSIQVGLKHQADVERLSVLALRPKRESTDPAADWARISAAIYKLKKDPALPSRLMRRSLTLLPVIIQNIEIFAQAAAEKFGSQRDGDQYGAMLAGAWSLFSTKVATIEQAREMIARHDWSEYMEGSETEESTKALAALLGRLVRVKQGIEVSVYELVAAAAGKAVENCDVGDKEASAILRRYGMQIKWETSQLHDAKLLVAYPDNVPELAHLMRDTPYAADVKGQLLRVPGAERHGVSRFLAIASRCIAIPMSSVLEGVVAPPPPAPFDFDKLADGFGDDITF